MAKVVAYTNKNGECEDFDSMLARFKRQVLAEGILYECKRREFFKSKALKKKEKSIEALKRMKKRQAKNRRNRQKLK